MDSEIMFDLLTEEQKKKVKERIFEKYMDAIDSIDVKDIRSIVLDIVTDQSETIADSLYEGDSLYNIAEAVGKKLEQIIKESLSK